MRRRVLGTLLCSIVLSSVLTGGSPVYAATKPITSVGGQESGAAEESGDASKPAVMPDDQTAPDFSDTVIDEQVLLDAENVRITATGFVHDDIWGDGVGLLIENNGSEGIGVGSSAVIVNDYMILPTFGTTVEPGKKSNETLDLSYSDLQRTGIDNIGQIEISFYLYDSESYETFYKADPAVIRTNHYDDMDTETNDAGVELYNADGIRIVGKYVEEDTDWGDEIVLYLENTSGRNVTVQCEDVSVNGFMVSPAFSCDLYDGKKAVSGIDLYQEELDTNQIMSVDDVELKFVIIDPDSYERIRTTDPISFSTN